MSSKSGPFIANGYVEDRGSTTMYQLWDTSGKLYHEGTVLPDQPLFSTVTPQTLSYKTMGIGSGATVQNGSTAANLNNYGVSLLAYSTNAGTQYTLNPPDIGVEKTLILNSTVSPDATGKFSVVGSGSTGIIFFDNSTTIASAQKLFLGFGPPLACVKMMGISTSAWAILNQYGNTKASTSTSFST